MDRSADDRTRVVPAWTSLVPAAFGVAALTFAIVAGRWFGIAVATALLCIFTASAIWTWPAGRRWARAAGLAVSLTGCGFGVAALVAADKTGLRIAALCAILGGALSAFAASRRQPPGTRYTSSDNLL